MATWTIDTKSEPGILRLQIVGSVTESEMQRFVSEHNAAVDSFGRADYRVYCDISLMAPLDDAAATLLEQAKRHSGSRPNFRGSAVKVSSAIVALQHRRTSATSLVGDTELVSEDETVLREHLRTVNRSAPTSTRRS